MSLLPVPPGPPPQELDALGGVQHRTLNLNGLKMHLAEAGSGDPVLLLHGFPQHSGEWRRVLPELARHHHVLAPDLRGAGQTDAPAGPYHRRQMRADVLALLDACGLERVHLIAHDWGALLGYQLCLLHPERIRSYVALGPHPFVNFSPRMLPGMWRLWFQFAIATPGLGPHFLSRGRQPLARYLFRAHTAQPELWTDDSLPPFLAPLRDPARPRAAGALYRQFILPEVFQIMTGWYKRPFATPTVVLHGAQDATLPAALLTGHGPYAPDLKVRIVKGAAHFLADEQPEVVVEEALRLFAQH